MDFTEEKTLGLDIGADFAPLKECSGYDQCYIIRDNGLRHAAWATGPETGIRMEVLTTLPGMHLYTANYLAPQTACKDDAPLRSPRCRLLRDRGFPRRPEPSRFPRYDPAAGCPVQLHHDLSVRHRTYVKLNAIT